MAGQKIEIGVAANLGQAEEAARKIDKTADGAADSVARIGDEAAGAAKNLNAAAEAAERLARAKSVLNRELGKPIADDDAQRFLDNFDKMKRGRNMSSRRLRSYDDFEGWWEGHQSSFGSSSAAAQHRRMVFSAGMQGTRYASQYGAPGGPGGGGGNSNQGGDEPPDNAPGSLARMGRRAGSMAWGVFKGGLALAGVNSIMGAVSGGVGKAQDEAISNDTLKRRMGDLGVDFEQLRERVRQTGEGMGLTYGETQRLAGSFAQLSGSRSLAGMREGIGLSRAYGMEPDSGVNFFGNMRRMGVANDDQSAKRLGLVISDAITQGGWTAKADEVLAAVTDYTQTSARVLLNTPNTGAYAGYLTALMSTGRPGLDPSGAAAILTAADGSVRRGGAMGEASLNFSLAALMRGLPGIDPVSAKSLMEGGLFGTTQTSFGSDSILGRWYGARGIQTPALNDTTNFERMMPLLREQYGDTPYMLEAVRNHFGLASNEQAAVLSGMRPADLSASRRLAQGAGVDMSKLSGTGMQMISQLAAAGGNGAKVGEIYDAVMNGDFGLSEEDKDKLANAMGRSVSAGTVDALRNALVSVVGTKEQEQTEGEKTRKSVTGVENAVTAMSANLLAPLNLIRDAIIAVAMHLSPGYRSAKEQAERQERVNAREDGLPEETPQTRAARTDGAIRTSLAQGPFAAQRLHAYDFARTNVAAAVRKRMEEARGAPVDPGSIVPAPDPAALEEARGMTGNRRLAATQEWYQQQALHDYAVSLVNPATQGRDQGNRDRLNGINSGGRVAGGVGMGGSGADRESEAMQYFMAQGWTRAQAAGIVGNLAQESGLDPTVSNRAGDSNAFGIAQWTAGRRRALFAFAGTTRPTFQQQLAFIQHELRTSESGAARRLGRATTAVDAAEAFTYFERAGTGVRGTGRFDPNNPRATHGWEERAGHAIRLAGPDVPAGDPSAPSGSAVNVQFAPATVTIQDSRGQTRGTAVLQPVAPPRPAGS